MLKAVFYAASLIAVGVGVHIAIGMPLKVQWLRLAALLLVLALLLRLLTLNIEISGGLGQVLDFSMFGWVWPGVRAQVIALSVGAACLAMGSVFLPRLFAGAGALMIATGFGLAGHTQALNAPGVLPMAVTLHVIAAGFWVLAPVILWPTAGQNFVALISRMHRFSRIAIMAVPVMIALGLWLAVEIAGPVSAVFEQPYGRLLLLKLAVASLALGIGAINKIYVTRRLEAGEGRALGILRLTLGIDLALFVVAVLAISAATTAFGPH